MRKHLHFVLGVILLLYLSSCKSGQTEPTVAGYFSGIQDSTAIIEKFAVDKMEFIAQIPVRNDSFAFYNSLEKKSTYQIRIGKLIVPFVYEGKPIFLDARDASLSCIEVKGSPATTELLRFVDKVERLNSQMGLYKMFVDSLSGYSGHDSLVSLARSIIQEVEVELNKTVREYLEGVKYFSLGLVGINYLNPVEDRWYLDSLVNTFVSRFPYDPNADSFRRMIIYNLEKINSAGINIGDEAPDFSLQNENGELIKLSSTRGKYVYLDFWASFCAPCRAESAGKVALYKEFSDENFTIISVSLDHNQNKWKAAIQQDSLTWVNLREPIGWDSKIIDMYKIEKMPFNYLLDPDGRIIAKNMNVEELRAKLEQLFSVNISDSKVH